MKRRMIGVAYVVLLLTAACGARLDKGVRTQLANAALHPSVAGAQSGGDVGGSAVTTPGGAATSPSGSNSATPGAIQPGGSSAAGGARQQTGTQSPGANAPQASVPAGGNGGATDLGVTATSITTGNVSDLSGPVPGLFQGGVYGVDAYYAYINSQGGIFGRQLKMSSADGQTDCTTNQNAHSSLLPRVFAFVGSFSIYDDCGTQVMQQHQDVPDVSYALGSATKKNTVNQFPPSIAPAGYQDGMFCSWAKEFGSAVTHVGAIFSNLPAASFSERMIEHAAVSGCGWHFTDSIPVGATQTTFNAELSKMQSDGVKVVFEIGTTQDRIAEMKREADQQGWKPIFISPVAYASNFVELVGSAQEAEGIVGSNLYSLFFSPDDAHNIPEVALYQQWMHLTHPDAAEDLYSMYSWAAAKLFVQELTAVGPKITRKAFIDAIRAVHAFDAAGLLTQSDIGGHKPGNCYVMWRIHNGQYARYNTPASQYRCDGEFVPYTGS